MERLCFSRIITFKLSFFYFWIDCHHIWTQPIEQNLQGNQPKPWAWTITDFTLQGQIPGFCQQLSEELYSDIIQFWDKTKVNLNLAYKWPWKKNRLLYFTWNCYNGLTHLKVNCFQTSVMNTLERFLGNQN